MIVRRSTFAAACIAAAALSFTAYVLVAAPAQVQPAQVHVSATGKQVSMDQAVRMVEQRYHARVVKAEAEDDNGRTVYLLRLLNDSGRVWTVRVDAVSGSVL
jgi:uncharacterized membrane protein YkoI